MHEYRLGDVLGCKVELADDHYIYGVRDGGTWLYIGKSVQPHYRLNDQHCHYAYPSNLGRAIRKHRPASGDWTYVLWHVTDCVEAVRYSLHPWLAETFEMNLDPPERQRLVIKEAERALIIKLRPLLNIEHTDKEPWSEGNHPDPGPNPMLAPLRSRPLARKSR